MQIKHFSLPHPQSLAVQLTLEKDGNCPGDVFKEFGLNANISRLFLTILPPLWGRGDQITSAPHPNYCACQSHIGS